MARSLFPASVDNPDLSLPLEQILADLQAAVINIQTELGITGATRGIVSDLSVSVQLDANSSSTTETFSIFKDSATLEGGTKLFEFAEDGNFEVTVGNQQFLVSGINFIEIKTHVIFLIPFSIRQVLTGYYPGNNTNMQISRLQHQIHFDPTNSHLHRQSFRDFSEVLLHWNSGLPKSIDEITSH